MTDIGYNDNLAINGRKFHIQTSTNVKRGTAQCEIFEEGKLINLEQIRFERRQQKTEQGLQKRIDSMVRSLHEETSNEIELLFEIAEKVKKLRHAPSNVKIGLIFLHNNLTKDAIEHFEIALSINPESIQAMKNLGKAYLQTDNTHKAIHILQRALRNNDQYPDLHLSMAIAYIDQKQYYKALNHLQTALKINPDYNEARYYQIILYLASAIHDKSDSMLPPPSIRLNRVQQQLDTLAQTPLQNFITLKKQIENLLKENQIGKALEVLKHQHKNIFHPEPVSLIGMDFYLKFMYGGTGMRDSLIKNFERKLQDVLEQNEEFADLWNNLGIVHLIQCRNLFLRALSEFDKALEINPAFEKAKKNKKLVENDGKEFLILLRAILR
ncbi:MAG: tetratricopeptide repeat protein [Caldithrix sp.]|nr:tetratricopeptide repeat protein [Caldithrix sp.]